MMPGFYVGQHGEVDGLAWEVREGRKKPGDKKLIAMAVRPGPVPMSWLALMTDFLYENEDILYPPPYKGGKKLMEMLSCAYHHGYEEAVARLRSEQRALGVPLQLLNGNSPNGSAPKAPEPVDEPVNDDWWLDV